MKRKPQYNKPLFLFSIIILLIGYFLRWQSSALRYSLYVCSLLVISVVLIVQNSRRSYQGRLSLPRWSVQPLLGIVLIIMYSGLVMILSGKIQYRFVQEVFFISLPIITSMALIWCSFSDSDHFFSTAFFFVNVALYTQALFKNKFTVDALQHSVDAILRSSIGFESLFSLMFGILAIYFFLMKRRIAFFAATILTIFGFKRIAIAGLILAIVVNLAIRILKIDLTKVWIRYFIALIAVVSNLLVIGFLVNASQGLLNDVFSEYTSAPIQTITQGRVVLHAHIINMLGFRWFQLGVGLGTLPHLLQETGFSSGLVNSDVFKLFYEVGTPIFVLLFGSIYYFGARSASSISLLIYTNVVMITDNVLVYSEFMILLCFLLGSLYFRERRLLTSIPIKQSTKV